MVSDQAVPRLVYSPRRPVPAVAVAAHRGVNEKQPLRGTTCRGTVYCELIGYRQQAFEPVGMRVTEPG